MKEYKYTINGREYNVTIGEVSGSAATVNVNGTDYTVELPEAATPVVNPVVAAAPAPARAASPAPAPAPAAKPAAAGSGAVVAPLPGVVLSIPVKVGDAVKAADTVIVLEAMKMENAIHAGRDGRVIAINVNQGDSVLEGAPLVTIG